MLLPPGTRVLVTRDAEPRDRYGRLLVYLERVRFADEVPIAVAPATGEGAPGREG